MIHRMNLSVVIPHTPGRETIKDTINSINMEGPVEIIISEDSPERLEQVTRVNEGVEKTTGDVILIIGDTGKLLRGWRKEVETLFKKIGNSGVVSLNGNLCGIGFVTRDFLEEYLGGYYYWPDYIHYHADQELGERARKAMKFVASEGSFVETRSELKPDPNSSQEFVEYDRTTFHRRDAAGFPNKRLRSDEERQAELEKHIK